MLSGSLRSGMTSSSMAWRSGRDACSSRQHHSWRCTASIPSNHRWARKALTQLCPGIGRNALLMYRNLKIFADTTAKPSCCTRWPTIPPTSRGQWPFFRRVRQTCCIWTVYCQAFMLYIFCGRHAGSSCMPHCDGFPNRHPRFKLQDVVSLAYQAPAHLKQLQLPTHIWIR